MKIEMNTMLHYFLRYSASDMHFTIKDKQVEVTLRSQGQMHKIQSLAFGYDFYQYLKYLSGFDLSDFLEPQSSSFSYEYENKVYHFRFSIIHSINFETGVLRMLYHQSNISLDVLSFQKTEVEQLKTWMRKRSGLIVLSGPTGSGKTTTLHALLQDIYLDEGLKIMTLEDPIEIRNQNFVQMQIQKERGFSWQSSLEHILRHDPDIIMLGEVRSEEQAAIMLRCALTGHLVLTTLHAKNSHEAIHRLLDLGLDANDLRQSIIGISTQRLYNTSRHRKSCLYELLDQEELDYYLEYRKVSDTYKNLSTKVQEAINERYIDYEEAKKDL